MTPPAVELVARLRARGVSLEPDGATLVVRPADAVSPDEVAALKRHKQQVLAVLRRSARPPRLILNPVAVRETLGPEPDEEALAALRFDVLAAVRQLQAEIQTGDLGSRPLQVRGHPLGDWLDLADVALLLDHGRTDCGRQTGKRK